ncbi:MAG: hypothetical protein Kow0090_03420 [Myxococcota bacterium]
MPGSNRLYEIISEEALSQPEVSGELLDPYINLFKEIYGEKLEAVIFYGSCLSEKTRKPDSTPDFFVITADGKIANHSFFTRLLHNFVPPNSQTARLEGGTLFKYIHLDTEQLQSATNPGMKDLFVAGRLSKRVKLVYLRDDGVKKAVVASLLNALYSILPLAFAFLPHRFSFRELLRAAVGVSYLSEWRVEAAGKIEALISASSEYYERLYREAAETAEERGLIKKAEDDMYEKALLIDAEKRAKRFMLASRIRGVLRWPKYLLTVKGWSEIIVSKIERTHPDIKLNPRHKRHPIIFGFPYLIFLLTKGYIGTHRT